MMLAGLKKPEEKCFLGHNTQSTKQFKKQKALAMCEGFLINKKMPSTGFEPVTFPMSRERATPAPTRLLFGNFLFFYFLK